MLRLVAGVSILLAGLGIVPAHASEATMSQVNAGACTQCSLQMRRPNISKPFYQAAPGPRNTLATVQSGDANVAVSMSFGKGNFIGQYQLGSRNRSTVGIFADDTSVSVTQDGSDLVSNLWLYGTPKSPIAVYQPQGSQPVNAAIWSYPNGQQVIRPGTATTVVIPKQ